MYNTHTNCNLVNSCKEATFSWEKCICACNKPNDQCPFVFRILRGGVRARPTLPSGQRRHCPASSDTSNISTNGRPNRRR
ncbi:Deleted in lung and esophageal cancer protein [Trichinella spiralis]|uniref:Deleted in lung and esophageal cancer protein n=1 Tax=Trichinella spiralis TaxID=6334 RepID=A0ABR3KFU7_TRISP